MPSAPPSSLFTPESVANGLLWCSEVLYLLGLLTLVLRLRRTDRTTSDLFDHLPAFLGLAAHLGALVARARVLGRFPVGTLGESLVFVAFLLAFSYAVAAARYRFPAVEALLLALVVLFQGVGILLPGTTAASAAPSLKSRWFVFHTLLSFLGVTALFGACVLSVLYLLADWKLKNKRPTAVLRLLPSLVTCDRAALRLLSFGFPLLTMGLLMGLFWTRESGTWKLGPKELWATIAWLLYGTLMLARWGRGWSGRKAAILSVTAAAAAVGAILGIRL